MKKLFFGFLLFVVNVCFGTEYLKPVSFAKPVTRFESLEGHTYEVVDISHYAGEAPAVGTPGLKVFPLSSVMNAGTVVLGFGVPNVFLAQVVGKNEVLKVNAKSLKRADTFIEKTNGIVQSGFFLVAKNLGPEIIDEIKNKALEREGTRNLTCVNANAQILSMADFHIVDEDGVKTDLQSYYFPETLLRHVLERGIRWGLDSIAVEFDIVKTTPYTLNEFVSIVSSAVNGTPFRHAERYFDTDEAKESRLDQRKKIGETWNALDEEEVDSAQLPKRSTLKFQILTSVPSYIGKKIRKLWDSHIVFKIPLNQNQDVNPVNIEDYFQEGLPAFNIKNPSYATLLKKHFLFSRPVLGFLNWNMAYEYEKQKPMSIDQFVDTLSVDSKDKPFKYNYVLTETHLVITRLSVYYGLVDWLLSKHRLMAVDAQKVLVSGELWKDEQGIVHINNNSGTYRPQKVHIASAVAFAHKFFDGLDLVGEVYQPV